MASKITKKLIAYEIEYFVKPYRSVKIFPAILNKKRTFSQKEKEELTRKGLRWYVYYDFIDPATGKYKRQTPITEKINQKYPEFDDRLLAVKALKKAVQELLKDGYNPNSQPIPQNDYSIADALEFAANTKQNDIKPRTHQRYLGTVHKLREWLQENGYASYSIKTADKPLLNRFLRHISSQASNRTRNNYRGDLAALFTVLVDEDYISENPAAKIKNLPTEEKRDPTYSEKQVKDIMTYLEANDPLMHLFIMMVSYMFWRPIEVTRIQVKDVNLEERLISEQTKTKGLKTKLIPEILLPYLQSYIKGANPEHYLFTPDGIGVWDAKETYKRSYFTRRYAGIKKHLKIDPQYTIYSFRHTYVTKVYKKLKEDLTEEQAMQTLANITGHTSKAIKGYIHWIDANLPEDYSKHL